MLSVQTSQVQGESSLEHSGSSEPVETTETTVPVSDETSTSHQRAVSLERTSLERTTELHSAPSLVSLESTKEVVEV